MPCWRPSKLVASNAPRNLEKNFDELAEKEVNKLKTVMTELQRAIQANWNARTARN